MYWQVRSKNKKTKRKEKDNQKQNKNLVGDEQSIRSNILARHEPGPLVGKFTGNRAETLALADGVEPQPSVVTEFAPRAKFTNWPRLLAQMVPHKVLEFEFAQKADALRVLARFGGEAVLVRQAAHL